MATTGFQAAMATLLPSLSPSLSAPRTSFKTRASKASIPTVPLNPKDPFLKWLSSTAAESPEKILNDPEKSDFPPFLDFYDNSTKSMASPAYARSARYAERRPGSPPPDLPSLLLDSRIVYIGMPLVPAVVELVVAQVIYLQYMDSKAPITVYVNSSGTARNDGQRVAMEYDGFAIYDSLMLAGNPLYTVALGSAIGMSCLLVAAGKKGRRYMLPHSTLIMKQPRIPPSGLMPADDVAIRAKEVIINRDTLVSLFAKHTGNSVEVVAKTMKSQYLMDAEKAIKFGVVDKVLEKKSKKEKKDSYDKLFG